MDHSLREPAAPARARQGRPHVGCSEKQFAGGQDVEISKLTDGGGVFGGETRGIFLTKLCPWTKHIL